jgi:hypothetical protein
MEFARHLDGALVGLGPGIAEEHGVGESVGHQLGRHLLLPGDPVQVGGMPQLARLCLQRRHQAGMTMAQIGHRDTGTEIKESAPVIGPQSGTLAAFEHDIGPRISRHDDRNHDPPSPTGKPETIVPDGRSAPAR